MVLAERQMEEAASDLAFEPIVARDASNTQSLAETALGADKTAAVAAMVLTTAALDALDAADAEQADIPAENHSPLLQPASELLDLAIKPINADAPDAEPVDLPELAEDLVLADSFTFDDDLLALFAMYDAFVPSQSEEGMIVIAPPPDSGAFLQVITRGPDGQWYTDSSMTTPFDGETFLPPIAICPVIDWDGSYYLPETGSDVLLG